MTETLRLPLTIRPGGGLLTIDQDSDAEIAQSVALLLDTRPGERRSVPDYGVPDPVFGGVDVAAVVEAVSVWEDRADTAFVEQVLAGVVDQAQVYPLLNALI